MKKIIFKLVKYPNREMKVRRIYITEPSEWIWDVIKFEPYSTDDYFNYNIGIYEQLICRKRHPEVAL